MPSCPSKRPSNSRVVTKNAMVSAAPAVTEISTQTGPTEEIAEIPVEVFRHALMIQLAKHVRAPTRRDLGTKIRKLKPIATCRAVVEEMLSMARGLPPEDEMSGIFRLTPGGVVKPTKSTSSGDTTKFKLQDPAHVKAFFSLEQKMPTRGLGAVKLNLGKGQEKRGLLAKTAAMAAAPVRGRAYIPKGKTARRAMPSITLSFNRCYMDENADVTFGVTTYPPWMKQRLRAELYKGYLEMGQRHLPVDPAVYQLVRSKIADTRLCGTYSVQGTPQLWDAPPLPPSPSPQQRKSKRSAPTPSEPKTSSKKRKGTQEKFEVEEIIEESGPWGGSSRWFVAQWAHQGYEPWWEQWRNAGGEPGTPVLTWMRLAEARKHLAFETWEAAKAAASEEA